MARKKEKDFIDKLEDEYSEYIVTDEDVVSSISTGSYSLDISTGIGGVPRGRCTEIFGTEGGGKTTLALTIARNAIKRNISTLYVDAEQAVDMARARVLIGEDVYDENKFKLLKPNIMETALQICEDGINSKKFGLVILDSIGSLAPRKVTEDALDDDNVALLARRLTIFLQRNVFGIQKHSVAFVGVNQIRDQIGSYIRAYSTPGGHDWRHVASLRVELTPMGGKEGHITQDDENIGINIRFTTRKNKLAPPFRAFYFPIMFRTGVDSVRDLVEFATTLGVITQGGSYYKFEDVVLANGMDGTIALLKENPETLDKIVETCYNVTNSRNLSKEI